MTLPQSLRSVLSRARQLAAGEWRATAQSDGRIRGYHLSALYSPLGWLSWQEIVRRFSLTTLELARDEIFRQTEMLERAVIATRQYAKRQRTWFRGRMADWNSLD